MTSTVKCGWVGVECNHDDLTDPAIVMTTEPDFETFRVYLETNGGDFPNEL